MMDFQCVGATPYDYAPPANPQNSIAGTPVDVHVDHYVSGTNTHMALTQEVTQKNAQRGQHLYVFQDSSGLIKIGRSSDPLKRRRTIETASGKKLSTVLVLHDRGDEEGMVLAAANAHRRTGEWFAGCGACRNAIEGAVGMELKWPLPLPQHLAAWRATKERERVDAAIAACVHAIKNPAKRGALSAAGLKAHNYVRDKVYGQKPLVLRNVKG